MPEEEFLEGDDAEAERRHSSPLSPLSLSDLFLWLHPHLLNFNKRQTDARGGIP
jgi:hypothetical protein